VTPTSRRLVALGRLAGLYARHVVRRAVRQRGEDGLAAFTALYTVDRITPLTVAERSALEGHGRCIGCGLCGFAARRAGYLRPERLPSQLTRSLPDLWTSRDLPLGAVDWASAAVVCPVGVPLAEMPGFVSGRLAADGTAAPPPPRPPATLPVRAVRPAPPADAS
jgi:hypothetical protein